MMNGAPSGNRRLKRGRWQGLTCAGFISNIGIYIAAVAGTVASKAS